MDYVKNPKKWKGATLMEVLTALVILAIVFSISLSIFINVSNSTTSIRKVKANQQIQKLAEETLKQKAFVDNTYQFNTFRIIKKVKNYKKKNGLVLLYLEAITNDGKKLTGWKRLIRIETTQQKP